MKLQTPLNHIRTDFSPIKHQKGIKSLTHKNNTLKGYKQAFAMIPIYLILVVIIGGMGYLIYKTQFVKGLPVSEDDVVVSIPNPVPVSSEQCPEGQAKDNFGQCVLVQCPQGQVRQADGSCRLEEFSPANPQAECIPSGYIKSAYVRTKGNVNEMVDNPLGSYPAVVTYQFQATSSCKARYYFEAGLAKGSALTILQSAGSKCDGNNHYAGRFITMDSNTIVNQGGKPGVVDIAFFPIDYGQSTKLRVQGGVYSGCLNDGGAQIDSFPDTLIEYRSSFNKWSPNDITNSWVKVK